LENELLLADKDGVAGIVPALVPRYDVELFSEQIDYFAFALVAPLGAQDDHIIHLFLRAQRTSPVRSFSTLSCAQRTSPVRPLFQRAPDLARVLPAHYCISEMFENRYNSSDAAFRYLPS